MNLVELSVDALKAMVPGSETEAHTSSKPICVHEAVRDEFAQMVEDRRWFHEHPELSFQEFATAKQVTEILRDRLKIEEVWTEVGQTGVVAMIRGEAGEGPCIMLRADMDGLPLQETADISYRSKNENVMHACGHDGHMAALIGAAAVLNRPDFRRNMTGSVKLCFQPAEEGKNGAGAMIKDGILEAERGLGPRVDLVYGIHLWSFERLGNVQASEGPVMAASDKFTIDVGGLGGHGAVPHQATDAIVSAATLVTSLQTIVSRNTDPLKAGVVSCCTIHGGSGYNIISDNVQITGTARSFTTEVQDNIIKRMGEICCGVQTMYGGETTLKYEKGYPPTVNAHPQCVDVVNKACAKIVGASRSGLPQKTMGAEDFSYFLEERPGCFYFVGAGKLGEIRPHHKSIFDFDERAMLVSAGTFVQIVMDTLFEE